MLHLPYQLAFGNILLVRSPQLVCVFLTLYRRAFAVVEEVADVLKTDIPFGWYICLELWLYCAGVAVDRTKVCMMA